MMAVIHFKGKVMLLHPAMVAAIVPAEVVSDADSQTKTIIVTASVGNYQVRDTLAAVEAEYVRALGAVRNAALG